MERIALFVMSSPRDRTDMSDSQHSHRPFSVGLCDVSFLGGKPITYLCVLHACCLCLYDVVCFLQWYLCTVNAISMKSVLAAGRRLYFLFVYLLARSGPTAAAALKNHVDQSVYIHRINGRGAENAYGWVAWF